MSKVSRGDQGEKIVSTLLGCVFPNDFYIFNNFTVLDDKKMSHQIDHILLSKKGIFVIETKNISNVILGSKEKPMWTIVGENDYLIKNPYYQNKNHIYFVSKILNTDKIFNIVCFVNNPFTKYVKMKEVINAKDIISYIRNNYQKDLFSHEQIEVFNKKLLKADTKVSPEEHVTNIFGRKTCIENHVCPICGGELRLITYKNNQFIGCENYPVCNFTTSNKKKIF